MRVLRIIRISYDLKSVRKGGNASGEEESGKFIKFNLHHERASVAHPAKRCVFQLILFVSSFRSVMCCIGVQIVCFGSAR